MKQPWSPGVAEAAERAQLPSGVCGVRLDATHTIQGVKEEGVGGGCWMGAEARGQPVQAQRRAQGINRLMVYFTWDFSKCYPYRPLTIL